MTIRTIGTSPRTYARIVGALYLLIFFVGPVAFFMGRTSVVVPGDPTATVNNLMASETMFRLGIVAETIIVLVEIVVSALLYALFRWVSRPLALAAALARFAQAVVQAVNLLTAVPALLLLGGAGYMTTFEPDQLNALVLLFLDANAFMIIIWGLVFGFHLLLLGYLVYKSHFMPRILGILLIIGAIGYLAQSYGHILVPQYDELLATVVIVLSIPGELAFTIWLLWKGVNLEHWEKRALEPVVA
jgi:Domain of unknown function (DUF4386)